MADDLGLDLGRVDVGSPGDDHVSLPVAQEKEPLVVEIANVTHGEEAPQPVRGRLRGIALVAEVRQGHPHVHGPRHAARALVPVVVGDHDLADRPRGAHRSRVGEPVLRSSDRAASLGGRVILVNARPPPVEHRPLEADRARRRGVNQPSHGRDVIALPGALRQRQHPLEMGRHHVRVGHPVALDQGQRLLGVPRVHVDEGVAHR